MKVQYEGPVSREHKGIHDVVDEKGFAMHFWQFQTRSAICKFFQCERINTAKRKAGLTSFLMLSASEARIFQ